MTHNEHLTVAAAVVATRSYNNFAGVTGVGEKQLEEIAVRVIGDQTLIK